MKTAGWLTSVPARGRVKILRLLNSSEAHASRSPSSALEGGYSVCAQLRLSKVIQADPGDSLTKAESESLRDSELDFVVYSPEGEPVLAVEFDGPCHLFAKNKARDIRKNRLCRAAGLPLLRVSDVALEDLEKCTILEFTAARFAARKEEAPGIVQEIEDYIQTYRKMRSIA